MRIFNVFFRRFLPRIVLAGLPLLCHAAGQPDNVVLQYHFLGATRLAQSPDVATAKKVFALRTTVAYENLILNRLAAATADYLTTQTNAETVKTLGPLLEEMMRAESAGSVGAASGQPLDFVLAIKLTKDRSQTWQHNLATVNKGPGADFHVGSFSGQQWNAGTKNAFWVVPAQDWLVVGKGDDLDSVRSDYLRQIQQTGHPGPALGAKCFTADINWPRLAEWAPLSSFPLKLGRTQFDITPQAGGLYMSCRVTYGEPIQWQPQPRRIPTDLIREPLVSFATGQDIEPFLKSDDTLAAFGSNPFRSQFYFWSMGEMPLESYVAWPDDDPKQTLDGLSSQALSTFNPRLDEINRSELIWRPDATQLVWTKLSLAAPHLEPAKERSFIVGGLFPLTPGRAPAPAALWQQFNARTDLIYYDWELTGPRILRLLSVTQMVPILQMLGIGADAPYTGGKSPADLALDARLRVQEEWLVSLTPFLGNTVTEVAKTGPAEVTVIRNSPFVFSSLELVLLSHLLTDTPAGPIDYSLIQQAKITGPGIPAH